MRRYYSIILIGLSIVGYFFYFSNRYVIGVPTEHSKCLEARYFIIDTWDKNIKEGDLVSFYMNVDNHFYPEGLPWVKKVAAGPNSTVKVTPKYVQREGAAAIPLDMEYMLRVLLMDNPIGTPADYTKTHELGSDDYFVVGETLNSYDSRFWGPISKDDIRGKAYAIF